MTKCRKLSMSECEYFVAGGCVSPFNCSYKAENESITTAISASCNLYPLEADKDKGNIWDNPELLFEVNE